MSTDLPLGLDLAYLDDLYARFLADPNSIDPSWRAVFGNGTQFPSLSALPAVAPPPMPATALAPRATPLAARFGRVYGLVNAYRVRGHLAAHLDPLEQERRTPHPDLDPRAYGFDEADMEVVVPSGGLFGITEAPLREIWRRLQMTYCRNLGVEMMHISAPERRAWLEQQMEPTLNEPSLDVGTRIQILDRLTAAEALESFVHTKYVSTKRFSLEGGDSLIPLLDLVLERAGAQGIDEAVIGMAHRGRLNVLANTMRKSAGDIFAEFEDIDPESVLGGGDVKYHLGFSSEHTTRAGAKMHLSLAFNPSHLEAVDPVVAGRVRAKQRRKRDISHTRVLGIAIHGDAAFAGQGLVAETLNLSQLHGYRIGGTVHVIVNNQIGFTTAPAASRSTSYPTDVAKMIEVPIFHVNGDDPDAVAQAVRLAMDYRREFRCDVVIDMFCFRKYGHNEGDEPSFTQPLLYQKIDHHPSVRKIYAEKLIAEGVCTKEQPAEMMRARQAILDEELTRARTATARRPRVDMMRGVWSGFMGGADAAVPDVETGVPREKLAAIAERTSTLPVGFSPHPKIERLLQARRQMGRGEAPLDWGMAEILAYGSLCDEGTLVRISGQDSRRGTFSHRHAAIVDVKTGAEFIPLQQLRSGQGEFRIYDSMLSEAAVLGFELGYSLDYPEALVAWEAQFGDFANGAQVIVDQFVSSAEDKWGRLTGIVLLLPHGYEGQGPEHSSARFERYLQLCAEDNMQVVYPSTPAQAFHLLRRQVRRPWRKPLVVMTPKSLLRLPEARSPLDDLSRGMFQRVLDDPDALAVENVKRIVLCTGKIFYDLQRERNKRGRKDVAIVRIEQLYPLRDGELEAVLARYPNANELFWVQEEPANMGAHGFLRPTLTRLAGRSAFHAVSRVESASPATGSYKAHLIEQQAILDQAFVER
jgi:2-oxoglutarate dehydrogenase E1 component